jgi:Bifunctional DNA primase/polymerase, N-terminal
VGNCGCFRFAAADPDVRALGLGAAALRYASLGFAVLPLQRGGKKPHRMLEIGGVHNATDDAWEIRQLWGHDRGANIGAATGLASRLVVIDLDVKAEADGPGQFRTFLDRRGLSLPAAPQVLTPSGGLHIWLRWPWDDPVPNRTGILPGVDIKGDGGYVAAPPSMLLISVSRERESVPVPYAWRGCPCSAPAAPGWIPGWLARNPGSGTVAGTGGEPPPDLDAARAGLPRGMRDRETYRLACSLFRRWGTTPAGERAVTAALRQVWDNSDKADFGWGQVVKCIRSARGWLERQEAEAG